MNIHIIIDVLLMALYLALSFGVGYVMGCWNSKEQWEEMHSEILVQHIREMETLKHRKHKDEEDWWK